jgi:hypothetical protein
MAIYYQAPVIRQQNKPPSPTQFLSIRRYSNQQLRLKLDFDKRSMLPTPIAIKGLCNVLRMYCCYVHGEGFGVGGGEEDSLHRKLTGLTGGRGPER